MYQTLLIAIMTIRDICIGWLKRFIFAYISQFVVIYYVYNNHIKNITLNYYLNYNMSQYRTGSFYMRIYRSDGVKHVAFYGTIALPAVTTSIVPTRKRFMLMSADSPVQIDLQILDNYYTDSKQFSSPVKNLHQILQLIGINCTHVTIIQLNPFHKECLVTADVDIDYLYV